jgi:hypothetical protein
MKEAPRLRRPTFGKGYLDGRLDELVGVSVLELMSQGGWLYHQYVARDLGCRGLVHVCSFMTCSSE